MWLFAWKHMFASPWCHVGWPNYCGAYMSCLTFGKLPKSREYTANTNQPMEQTINFLLNEASMLGVTKISSETAPKRYPLITCCTWTGLLVLYPSFAPTTTN